MPSPLQRKKKAREAARKAAEEAAQKAAEKHSRVKAINEKIKENKLIVEFLEKSERIFSSMSFDIKNITEIMKLETM